MNTISLVNEGIMENGKMNKVTKTTKEDAKTTSRGEKCLAKFTAANGNVYGSLTLTDDDGYIGCIETSWSRRCRFL